MTGISQTDERELDLAFERQLLSSAGADGPSESQLRHAWPRFLSATGAAALAAGVQSQSSARALARARVTSFVAGALGGALVTLAWFTASPEPRLTTPPSQLDSPAPARGAAPLTPPPLHSATSAHRPARELEPAPELASPPELEPRRIATPRVSNPEPRTTENAPGSTLAAEIESLDAARSALAAGRSAEALELTEAHRRRFPSGQLASDVEALAIDSLARAGRYPEATARATRFLTRFPKSPHAARIARIAAKESATAR